ncbi:MAG: hypothetical protein IJC90_03285 [Clostridia bacterium]|nr:hypothetical protein [Clostridia bacterium]
MPNISTSKYSDDEKFYLLKNYLYELNECLSFALSNIDYSNLKESIKNKIEEKSEEKISYENLIKENKEKFENLKNKIIITADEIFENCKSEIKNSENEILGKVQNDFLAISEFGEYKSETASIIKENADAITLNSSNIETANNNLENYKSENNSELNLRAEAIISQVENIFAKKSEYDEFTEIISSQITQTSKNITENFENSVLSAKEDISTLGGTVSELIYSLNTYIKRGELESGVYGIEIGRSDSNIKARFTNEKLSFLQGTTEVAYISGNNLYILRAEIIDYIKIGDIEKGYFIFDVTDNGLEVKWSYGN